MNRIIRVGFVLDGLAPTLQFCFVQRTFRPMFTGWWSGTSVAEMRFDWIAKQVNNQRSTGLQYELYKPWRSYEAVVFLKSMNEVSQKLASQLRRRGIKTIFDANVDYFTSPTGQFYYDGMAPTPQQQEFAINMARRCDCVIGDSKHITEKALAYTSCSKWIPDNVRDLSIRDKSDYVPRVGSKLPLMWCGEAVKLFDLLQIEKVLRRQHKRTHLRIITNSLASLDRIYEPWRGRLRRLLADLDCEIIPFNGIDKLLQLYDQGGVFISPRFLNNSYNLGHTEWKVTLPMAKGRVVLCSPQASYRDLAARSNGQGIRVCGDDEEWDAAFDDLLSDRFDWKGEQQAACNVVRQHYATSVVASAHVEYLKGVLAA